MEGSDTATLQPLSAGDGLPFPTLRGLRVPKSFDRSREDTRMDETGPLETAKIPGRLHSIEPASTWRIQVIVAIIV
jgi:hypothetical protein